MKNEILLLIQKGDLPKAMSMMHDYSTSSNFGNITHEIYLHQSKYSRNELDFVRGMIKRDDFETSLNRITIALLGLVDKMFVPVSEYIPENKAQYFTLFYSTDKKKVVSFQVIFDNETRKVVINNTRSKSEYKGKYYIYSNHTCLTVENNTKYCINLILFSGAVFPHIDQEICIGIVNLIGIDGVACASSAVLKRGKQEDVTELDNTLVEQFILHRPVLGIHNSIKGIFCEEDLRKKIDSESVINSFAGNYMAIIVSSRRKVLIPYALEIMKTGILISHREPKQLSNLDGIVHVIDKNTITINVYLNHKDERIFAEFRVYLDTSNTSYRRYNFYRGTYSSISYRGKEPRGGRCLMIKVTNKKIEQIPTKPIGLNTKQYDELVKKYPKIENYLQGMDDDFVENYKEILQKKK